VSRCRRAESVGPMRVPTELSLRSSAAQVARSASALVVICAGATLGPAKMHRAPYTIEAYVFNISKCTFLTFLALCPEECESANVNIYAPLSEGELFAIRLREPFCLSAGLP
jgi:hypothetical protein